MCRNESSATKANQVYLLEREVVAMHYAQGPGVVTLLGYLQGDTMAGESLVQGLVMEMMDLGSLDDVVSK
jgi:hypothetical protein